jgi:putative two-component system response regulator
MNQKTDAILIVDDEKPIRKLLNRKLSELGYQCQETGDAERALEQLRRQNFGLVILDNKMPGRSGIDLLPDIVARYPHTSVIMATATNDISIAIECLKQGACDYITKPFNLEQVALSVNRALEKRSPASENSGRRHRPVDKIIEHTGTSPSLSLGAISSLVNALEAKNKYKSGHSQRVAYIAVVIAKEIGLSPQMIDSLQIASLVHNIGNIGVREIILNKTAPLTLDELEHIQKHPEIGEHILVPLAGEREILKIVRNHHEHYDGTGYPDGLKASHIPLGARILAVADAYEAMISERPYRAALSPENARTELERSKGTQFDPVIVDAFSRCYTGGFLNSGKFAK